MGDFNYIVSHNEHKGGSIYYYSRKAGFFVNFIKDKNLLDLHFSGPKFTWCNNQLGSARRWARLDRCLVNLAWFSKFHSYSLKHLLRIFSDHAPLLLIVGLHASRCHSAF